jgi:MoaA/NifB/PqqE/SkfB family radical SAM enzyme
MTTWSYFRGADIFDIKVGYRCNNACIHCIVEPVRHRIDNECLQEELGAGQIEELLDAAVASEAKQVVLTGGEITLRPDFIRIVHSAASRGLRILVQTNGRMFSRKSLCDSLADISGVKYMVALHGSTALIHDNITKRKGSFQETCIGLQNLSSLSCDITVKMVLLKMNIGNALSTADLAKKLGAKRMCIVFPHFSEFSAELIRKIVPSYSEIESDVRVVCQKSESNNFPTSFENIPYCTIPDLPAFWSRNCDLFSQTSTRSVPFHLHNSQFDWEELRKTMKTKQPVCRQCAFDHICEGPWKEYVQLFGDEEFNPVHPSVISINMGLDIGASGNCL